MPGTRSCGTSAALEQVKEGLGVQYDFVMIKEDTSRRVVSYILEHTSSFPGVEVRQNYLRDYPDGELARICSATSARSPGRELKQSRFRRLRGRRRDRPVGRRVHLRPLAARRRRLAEGRGRRRGPPQAGRAGRHAAAGGRQPACSRSTPSVQRAAENAVNYGIDLAHANNNYRADAGAAVVLDAHTGERRRHGELPDLRPLMVRRRPQPKHWKKLNVNDQPRSSTGRPRASTRWARPSRWSTPSPASRRASSTPSTVYNCPGLLQPTAYARQVGVALLDLPGRSRLCRPDARHRRVVRRVLLQRRLRLLSAQGRPSSRTGPSVSGWVT